MSDLVFRIYLQALAAAASVLLLPSAAIYGGMLLMGWAIYAEPLASAGWEPNATLAQILHWLLPSQERASGTEAMKVFAAVFFKVWLVLAVVVLAVRAVFRIRGAPSFRARLLWSGAFAALLWIVFAILLKGAKMAPGTTWAGLVVTFGLLCGFAWGLALPYLGVTTLIDRALAKLDREDDAMIMAGGSSSESERRPVR
jgi:hypothetical protein